ncbi:MAG: NAD(P)H-dependent oxidoreductase [Catalinimonas sp.]
MHLLIVFAYPELFSFGGALLDRARQTLSEVGHTVEVSDLYRNSFEPRGGRHDFITQVDGPFHYQRAQEHAARHGGFEEDIRGEMDKLARADAVIFQFPLWWFSVPAVLKGWFDRVLARGVAYGPPAGGSYRTGPLRGKRALLSLTTSEPELAFGEGARNGDLHSLLYPVQRGTLYYTGMAVLPPFVAWAPEPATPRERRRYLDLYAHRLRLIARTPPLYPAE